MNIISEKIKPMTLDELILAVDRLTRFKFPEDKYNRVFKEMISKYLISPKIGFKDYDKLSNSEICGLVEQIFETSISCFNEKLENYDKKLYKNLANFDNNLFNVNEETKRLMDAQIPYEAILTLMKKTSKKFYCKNLKFLNELFNTTKDVKEIRQKEKTLFPIEKVVLAEGITEEILLPKFANILGFDFDENGIVVIPAGGKNQVAKEYINLRERLKVPIVILLDADATEVAQRISNKLRTEDKLILIEKGEFEDILPLSLLKMAINYKYINIFKIKESDFSDELSRVKDLEEIYRINGLGEFKKAEFAHNIETILDKTTAKDVSVEIKHIVDEIKQA